MSPGYTPMVNVDLQSLNNKNNFDNVSFKPSEQEVSFKLKRLKQGHSSI